MQIFSYPGCQKCLVKMCCHNVCKDYRQHISETRDFAIMIDVIPLKSCEEALALRGPDEKLVEIDGQTVRVSIDIRGIA